MLGHSKGKAEEFCFRYIGAFFLVVMLDVCYEIAL